MEAIIRTENKTLFEGLLNFLKTLHISVETKGEYLNRAKVQQKKALDLKRIPLPKKQGDFTGLFGIWKNNDITLEQIRAKAWPVRK